ncbi:MAG: hypothetical protein WAK17_27270 [Candidatus Nitrosopolaris sp.]|jgi:hypothetical protein
MLCSRKIIRIRIVDDAIQSLQQNNDVNTAVALANLAGQQHAISTPYSLKLAFAYQVLLILLAIEDSMSSTI